MREECHRYEKMLAERGLWKHIGIVKWIIFSLLVTSVAAEKSKEALAYSQSRALMEELMKVERAIDTEKKEWRLKQQNLQDLIEVNQQELSLITEELSSAGSSVESLDQELEEVKKSIAGHRKSRAALTQKIDAQSKRLFALIAMFPEPLRKQLSRESGELLKDDLVLKEKVAAVVRVLKAADKFNRVVSYSEEMHEVDGVNRQLRVLYVGLAGAYYVSGDSAGTGKPSAQGWVWQSNNDSKAQITRAIAVFQKTARPQLVSLPVEVDGK